MPQTYNPETIRTLDKLNATFRFTILGGKLIRDSFGHFETDPASPSQVWAEIIDKTTGQGYCKVAGANESEALDNAVAAALTAPKPLTAAQKADPNFVSQAARIAELEAKLAAATAKPSEPSEPAKASRQSSPARTPHG